MISLKTSRLKQVSLKTGTTLMFNIYFFLGGLPYGKVGAASCVASHQYLTINAQRQSEHYILNYWSKEKQFCFLENLAVPKDKKARKMETLKKRLFAISFPVTCLLLCVKCIRMLLGKKIIK